jgi:hypothetical protein
MLFSLVTLILVFIFIVSLYFLKQFFSKKLQQIGENSPFLRNKIWKNTLNKYGLLKTLEIFPKTYLLPEDFELFLKEENPNKEYIVKTLYSGGRKGVFLYNQKMKKEINKYAIIQEYIPNPLLINNFKFNTRLFMVIDNVKGVYLYKKGYNAYTSEHFNYKSKKRSQKINQAYADDYHYNKYNLPKTTDELNDYMIPYDKIVYDVAKKLQKIIKATPDKIISLSNSIYGVDIEILNNFDVKIIEINSKPTTEFPTVSWKDNLTKNMKKEINDYRSSNWIQILDKNF